MAITEYYVSPASGNDTTGNGTIGTPWATVQKALNTITRNATDGDRVNVQAGTADTLGATLTLATYGSPSSAAPLIIQGYTSAQGDGGIGEIDGAATYAIYDSTANSNKDGIRFVDMKLGNCGTAKVIYFRFQCALINCEVYGSSADAAVLFALSGNQAIGCLFHTLTGANNVSSTNASNVFAYCTFRSGGGTVVLNCSSASPAIIVNNVFDLSTDTSLTAITASNGGYIANNTIYTSAANVGEGILINAGSNNPATVVNNLIVGYSGAGGDGLYLNATQFVAVGANAYYNNTTELNNAAKVAVLLAAPVTLSGDPFVDAANDDFNLAGGSEALGAAWPSAFKGMASTSNDADIGAVQAGAGAGGGGGPVIGSRIIRGLGAV